VAVTLKLHGRQDVLPAIGSVYLTVFVIKQYIGLDFKLCFEDVCCLLSVVMRATAHVKNPDTNTDSDIVQQIGRLLKDLSPEELAKVDELVQLQRQGIELLGASDGSVDVLFWCREMSGLTRLHEWLVNGRIRDIVKILMNRVMKRLASTARIAIDLDWSEQEYDVCVKYFHHFPSGRSSRFMPTVAIRTAIAI